MQSLFLVKKSSFTGPPTTRDILKRSLNEEFPIHTLSPREYEVCLLLVEGHAVKEVAARCKISTSTADAHARRVYKKLGVHSRAELIGRVVAAPVLEVRQTSRSSDHLQIVARLEKIEASLREIVACIRAATGRGGLIPAHHVDHPA